MDLSQTLNSNTAQPTIVDPKYINFDYIFNKIYQFFTHFFDPSVAPTGLDTTIKFILAAFSILFIFVIVYSFVRLLEIRKKEHAYFHHEIAEYRERHAGDERAKMEKTGSSNNDRWDAVLQYLFSANSGDWKLAVIDADSMLDGLMDQLGFKGESLGEKLKAATQDTFKSLTAAWEVHTIRNRIAHEGQQFDLSHHEAKRVIAIYENIFRQYGYI